MLKKCQNYDSVYLGYKKGVRKSIFLALRRETLNTEILMTKKSFEISKGPKVFLPTTISIRKFKVFSSSERRIIRCSIDKKGAC